MFKKRSVIILLSLLILSLFIFGVHAQEDGFDSDDLEDFDASEDFTEFEKKDANLEEETLSESERNILDDVVEEHGDVGFDVDPGLTPDNTFYFVDKFFDRCSIENKDEKIAEIKSMIESGNEEAARESFANYEECFNELETEIDPDDRDKARRSAAAVVGVKDDLGNFGEDIVNNEGRILTSAEIASKIKELCETLSDLDPLEYSRVCKISEDTPDWHKKLDRDLTDKQREEARKFGRIMKQCFETAGQECACEEIPFKDFAETCSVAAPLATACEIGGNEEACEQLDSLEMPELPPHLQDVFDDLEKDVSESRFELHMPRECIQAGATSSRECMKIMVKTNAPPECRNALIEADVQSEREAREICEEIMFEIHAPQECIDAGLRDPKECGVLMFQQTAPQECIDAGLTGEHQSDHKKCREIMDSLQGDRSRADIGPGFGFNCREIQNSEERLRCYDGASQGANEYKDDYDGRRQQDFEAQRQCAESCLSRGGAWDFRDGNCQCSFPEHEEFRSDFENEFRDGSDFEEEFREEEKFEEDTFTEETQTTESSTSSTEEATTEESTTTNSADRGETDAGSDAITETGAFITGNAFLRYHYF